MDSRVAQWKRAGPITQRSVDRNYPLLELFFFVKFDLSFSNWCYKQINIVNIVSH